MPILMSVLYWLDYYSFVVNFEIGNHESSNSFFFFNIILVILGLLHFQVNLRISLSISSKKKEAAETLVGIVWNM